MTGSEFLGVFNSVMLILLSIIVLLKAYCP